MTKMYKLPIIRKISTRDVMYNIRTVVNPAIFGKYMKVVKRVYPKNSYYMDKILPYFYYIKLIDLITSQYL